MGIILKDGPGLRLVDRAWFNGNLQGRWFIVSALGGIISMVVVMFLTSLSVARNCFVDIQGSVVTQHNDAHHF